MIPSRELIRKADLAVADLNANGGLLTVAQAQKFIRKMIDEAVLLKMATVVPMRSYEQNIDKAQFGSRILRAAAEAQALGAADRAKPDLEQVVLTSKLFKAEVRLSTEVLEDNIERQSLRNTILSMMGERISLDIDELIALGDTVSADPFLAKMDGLIKLAAANTVSGNSNPISKYLFRDMLKTLPKQYLRNKSKMRFLTSVDTEIDYRDSLSDRETGRGDVYLERDVPVAYSGVPIVDVPVFPENLGVGTDETVALLMDPKNMQVGFWRKITMESDKDITSGVLILVASLRIAFTLAEDDAVVKATEIAFN